MSKAAMLRRIDSLEGRYVIAGGYNTAVGILLYLFFFGFLGDRYHYLLLLTGNYAIGTINGYLAYKIFVFRTRADCLAEYMRFNAVHLAGIVVNYITLPLLVEFAGFKPFVAQGLIILMLIVASFVLHKHFTFRQSGSARRTP